MIRFPNLIGTVAALAMLASCAQDVGDVDRTQPNRLKKSLFEGEWYVQKTTFDVPYTAGFTFIGETSELERVKWEIQEKFLIAYRTYDRIENTQLNTTLPGVTFKGAPVAAYAIEGHFDVTREYNPLTGEETNVLSENVDDRPWYEREYVRVDWSKNLVMSFAFLDDQVAQSPMDFYVQDRGDADRLLIGVRDGDTWTDHQDWDAIASLDRADYIDVVDTLFASPETYEYEDEYGYIYEEPACWFYGVSDCQPARVKVRSSFLKVPENSGYEAMAYPDNEVLRKDDGTPVRDEYGEAVRIPYFDKFGYFRVERDYYDRDRERTESGRTFLINRWALWKDAPACKNGDSYENCEVRPIVFHLSPGYPEALKPVAQQVAQGWNQTFKQVVNQLKYRGARPLEQVEDVFVLKDNDFSADNRGQRIGDLRNSYLYWIPEPQSVGPLGYGPSAVDPLTGQIISGSAYVYGAALESWGAWGADVVQLLNGAIAPDDFIEGEDVRAYVAKRRGDYAVDATEIGQRGRDRSDGAKEWVRSPDVRKARDTQKRLGKRGMRLDGSKLRAKLQAIRNTPFEDKLLHDEVVRGLVPAKRGEAAGLVASLSPEQKARISPARWGTHSARRAQEKKRRLKMQMHSLELASFADDSVAGLAETLKGKDWQTARNTILESVMRSTAEHEIGHTLGLRHNFAGSFDALNYSPEYWRMRGNNPQPFVDMTEQQSLGRMREYQYASIMDYSARFNSDIHGLGRYDKAAIMFGYGSLVETFEVPPNEPLTEIMPLAEAIHELRHYTSLPGMFRGDVTNLDRRRLVPYKDIIKQMAGTAPQTMVEVPYRFCSDEYEGALPSCNTWDEGADSWEVVNNADRAYEDYYLFNSFGRDRREIDPWEHTDWVYSRYFLFGQLQYQDFVFRAFDLDGLWEELRLDPGYWNIEDVPFDEALDGNLSGALGSRVALNGLARVMQAPEPGAYYLDTDENGFYNFSYDQDWELCPAGQTGDDCSDFNVALGDGKYAFSLYDGDTGYYFYERVHVIGSFYDKLAALQTLTSPDTYFLGVDQDANLTAFAISMYFFFPEQVTRLVGGSAVEGYGAYAGVAGTNREYTPRDMFAPIANYAGKQFVDPATSFTVELYAAWMGMAFLNANFDNSFNDLMRVFEEGSGDGYVPTVAPERIARYTHPRTGRTFVAIRAEDPNKYSPAHELLTRLAYYEQTVDPEYRDYYVESYVAIIDNLRGLHELYGKLAF